MFQVDKEKCVGCKVCVDVCPVGAISMVDVKAQIDANKCVDCGRCAQACLQEAIYPDPKLQQNFLPNQEQMFPNPGFGMGRGIGRGMGRGLGKGFGRGLRRGPRDGRGRGRGGGGN